MKVSDYIADFLDKEGVSCVFELSGGMITHLLDSLYRLNRVRLVSMHHEQGAAFAADAIGRITGIPGVALATSGPGATNLLTGIGSCYFDSSPGVFITGQVNRDEQKGARPIRQLGFQETDIVAVAGPITKAAWRVTREQDIPELLRQAFDLATSGRPGPVLLDVPMDVQREDIPAEFLEKQPFVPASSTTIATYCERLATAILNARRPLILAGGGIRAAGTTALLRDFANRVGVPVVNSLMAVDALPFDDPLHVGMIGSYGNRWANLAIGASDLLIVLGSRLDIRQTGADTTAFKEGREIFHVDCEEGELNNRVVGCQTLVTNLQSFFAQAGPVIHDIDFPSREEWLAEINDLRQKWPDTGELPDIRGINPNQLMHSISAASAQAGVYIVDVGQHQMWAGQSIDVRADQRFITSGGMGSMGFGLPASVGAALAIAPRPVVLIAGDGGFQCNIQELQTVVRNKLPIKIVIVNNRTHGMVRQFQESYFDGRHPSTLIGYSAPDFVRVAEAYGIPGKTIEDTADIDSGLDWLWRDPLSPGLLQVMVDTYTNVYPKIAFGHPITGMEPMVKPLSMEST